MENLELYHPCKAKSKDGERFFGLHLFSFEQILWFNIYAKIKTDEPFYSYDKHIREVIYDLWNIHLQPEKHIIISSLENSDGKRPQRYELFKRWVNGYNRSLSKSQEWAIDRYIPKYSNQEIWFVYIYALNNPRKEAIIKELEQFLTP